MLQSQKTGHLGHEWEGLTNATCVLACRWERLAPSFQQLRLAELLRSIFPTIHAISCDTSTFMLSVLWRIFWTRCSLPALLWCSLTFTFIMGDSLCPNKKIWRLLTRYGALFSEVVRKQMLLLSFCEETAVLNGMQCFQISTYATLCWSYFISTNLLIWPFFWK